MQWDRMIKESCLLTVVGQWAASLQSFLFAGSVSHPQRNPWTESVAHLFSTFVCASNREGLMRSFHKAARRVKRVPMCCWSFFPLGPLLSPSCLGSLKHGLIETRTWINTWSCLLRQKSNSRWEPATVTVEGFLLLHRVNLKQHKKSESLNSLFWTKLPPCLCLTLELPHKKSPQPANSGDLNFTRASEAILSWH